MSKGSKAHGAQTNTPSKTDRETDTTPILHPGHPALEKVKYLLNCTLGVMDLNNFQRHAQKGNVPKTINKKSRPPFIFMSRSKLVSDLARSAAHAETPPPWLGEAGRHGTGCNSEVLSGPPLQPASPRASWQLAPDLQQAVLQKPQTPPRLWPSECG